MNDTLLANAEHIAQLELENERLREVLQRLVDLANDGDSVAEDAWTQAFGHAEMLLKQNRGHTS